MSDDGLSVNALSDDIIEKQRDFQQEVEQVKEQGWGGIAISIITLILSIPALIGA